MDVSAVVLNKVLSDGNIDVYSKLKLVYLDPSYTTLYHVIASHYEKYGNIPSFNDLELSLREGQASKTLAAIKLLEVPDVSSDAVLDALINEYTQAEAIKLLERFIDKLPLYDSEEIKNNLAEISLEIEEKILTSENVYTMNDLMVFQHQEDLDRERLKLGLNYSFDEEIGGMARQEVLFLGGMRGSGKSLVSSNIFINQYEKGNSCLFFSIEMTAFETHQRHLSMLSGVPLQHIKKNELSQEEVFLLADTRAGMFQDSANVLDSFKDHGDRFRFEAELVRNCNLKSGNQMVIIDDRNLTLGAIDLHIGKAKARFGDKLGVVIVDYINQIVVEGNSQFDWQPQIEIAKKLKNLARKHEVVLISPYQIDSTGEARFSKGILDSADIALTLQANDESITFQSTKMRGAAQVQFTCPTDWNTLKVSPQSIDNPPPKDSKEKKTKKETKEAKPDLPWDL